MQKTMHLLDKALTIEPNTAELCRKIKTATSAIRVARHNGAGMLEGRVNTAEGDPIIGYIARLGRCNLCTIL